jgi:hypothetical protein
MGSIEGREEDGMEERIQTKNAQQQRDKLTKLEQNAEHSVLRLVR